MTSHTNFYIGNPNNPADRETARKLEEARQLSNQAGQTEAAGNVAHAIELHNQALALKVQCFGEQSVQAGLSFNEVGECYLKTGDLQKAEENLLQALKVRDDRKFGGLEIGPRFDAAVTREYVGQLREAQGQFAEAKEVRRRGVKKGQQACGWNKCPGQMFTKAQLSACSGCTCVWYCCKDCQKSDWKARHKPLCQQHGAAAKLAVKDS